MPLVHIVHCIDTEGPLSESLVATFERIKEVFGVDIAPSKENLTKLQEGSIELNGLEDAIRRMVSPKLLSYNSSFGQLRKMLLELLSKEARNSLLDSFGEGWIYSWHCMDHIDYKTNPRNKKIGYGEIFKFYRDILEETNSNKDEINWHFHPISITKNSLNAATSYLNSYPILLQILCKRVIEDNWFPVVNRPGFHSIRPDSHNFLENWIPFDYSNQSYEDQVDQPDLSDGRFGDWRRAPTSWRGYHPSHEDYQVEGSCNRTIFRCLNLGTRFKTINLEHIHQAFSEAEKEGKSILSFANHDYRDMREDLCDIKALIKKTAKVFPQVNYKFSGAEEAATDLINEKPVKTPELDLHIEKNILHVSCIRGNIFGPQPFLSIKDKKGNYFHDNFDLQVPKKLWTYTFDNQTLPLEEVAIVGAGTAGIFGGSDVKIIKLS